MEFETPASLYGLAIAEFAMLDRVADGNLVYFVEVARVSIMLLMNLLLTCLFVAQVGKMVAEQYRQQEPPECESAYFLLSWGCVFVFETSMLTHVRKSVTVITMLYHASPSRKSVYELWTPESASAGTGAIMAQEQTGLKKFTKKVVKLASTLGNDDEIDPAMKRWTFANVGVRHKVFCTVCIALPKLLVDLILVYLGGLYVVLTQDPGDMLLNTLSLVFVVEIDNLMYMAFTSDAMRSNLEHMHPVVVHLTNKWRIATWLGASVVSPLCVMVLTSYLVLGQSFCHRASITFADLTDSFNPFRFPHHGSNSRLLTAALRGAVSAGSP